jgi:hypothetical protein
LKITLFADPLKIQLLAHDLERITRTTGPTESELYNAPVLLDWHLHWQPTPVLVGSVTGHPELRNGRVKTSQLFALDLGGGAWARTASRWYRLEGRRDLLDAGAEGGPTPPHI